MQTFVPYENHENTARSLDRMRLGKQRVECLQILIALRKIADGEVKVGWGNHPAVRMWRGHERALGTYAGVVCDEWSRRGYVDNVLPKIQTLSDTFPAGTERLPAWWGREDVHASHVARLLVKDRTHYQAAFRLSDDEVDRVIQLRPGYVWPVEGSGAR